MSKQQASNYYLFYIAADISYTVPAIMITVTDLGPSVRKKILPNPNVSGKSVKVRSTT